MKALTVVCLYESSRVCTHTHIHTYPHSYTQPCTHSYLNTHSHTHTYTHVHTHTLTFLLAHLSIHTHISHMFTNIHMQICALTHIPTHTHTSTHSHVHTLEYTHAHTHTHTLERTQAHTHAQPHLSFPGPINPVFSALDHEWHEAEWGGHPFLHHCPGQWYREAGTGLTRPLCSLVPGWGQRLVGSCPPPSAFTLLAQIWTDPAAGGGR